MRLDTQKMRQDADAKLAAAQAEHARRISLIEEIERTWSNGESVSAPQATAKRKSRESVSSTVSRIVLRCLAGNPDGATLHQIYEYVSGASPAVKRTKKQVARLLYKMHTRKEIVMTRKQSGLVPGLYALPKQGKPNTASPD